MSTEHVSQEAEDDEHDQVLPSALPSVGICHMFDNAEAEMDAPLPYFNEFMLMLRSLIVVFQRLDLLQLFKFCCVGVTTYSVQSFLFDILCPRLVSCRWGYILKVFKWLMRRMAISLSLRESWRDQQNLNWIWPRCHLLFLAISFGRLVIFSSAYTLSWTPVDHGASLLHATMCFTTSPQSNREAMTAIRSLPGKDFRNLDGSDYPCFFRGKRAWEIASG